MFFCIKFSVELFYLRRGFLIFVSKLFQRRRFAGDERSEEGIKKKTKQILERKNSENPALYERRGQVRRRSF